MIYVAPNSLCEECNRKNGTKNACTLTNYFVKNTKKTQKNSENKTKKAWKLNTGRFEAFLSAKKTP